MRILAVSSLYPPEHGGGVGILTSYWCHGLRHAGYDVIVVTSESVSCQVNEKDVLRVLEYVPPPTRLDPNLPMWRQLEKAVQYRRTYVNRHNANVLRKAVQRVEPDAMILFFLYGIGILSILHLARSLPVPSSCYLQEYSLLSFAHPNSESSTFRISAAKRLISGWTTGKKVARGIRLIAVSNAVKEKYVMEGGFSEDEIEVVYPGLPMETIAFSRERTDVEDSLRLLFSGRLVWEKGLHVLLSALGHLASYGLTDWHLDVAGGKGPVTYMKELRALIQSERLEPFVTLHGWLPQSELMGLYRRSHILVVPSIWQEPFGMVAIEGMARGLPVVASRIGGLQEIVTDGLNGFLFPPDDVKALAQILASFVDCQHDLSALSENACRTVRERFSIEQNALCLLDLITWGSHSNHKRLS